MAQENPMQSVVTTRPRRGKQQTQRILTLLVILGGFAVAGVAWGQVEYLACRDDIMGDQFTCLFLGYDQRTCCDDAAGGWKFATCDTEKFQRAGTTDYYWTSPRNCYGHGDSCIPTSKTCF